MTEKVRDAVRNHLEDRGTGFRYGEYLNANEQYPNISPCQDMENLAKEESPPNLAVRLSSLLRHIFR